MLKIVIEKLMKTGRVPYYITLRQNSFFEITVRDKLSGSHRNLKNHDLRKAETIFHNNLKLWGRKHLRIKDIL